MSERLARSEEEVEFSRAGLVRKNQELEERRRLTETVLETVGTGVVVVDQEGTLTAANAAAQRLLDLEPAAVGLPLDQALKGAGREEIHALVLRLLSGRVSRQEREVIVPSRERDRHLAVTVVTLPGSLGAAPGALVVVDDLTPLMRAQKVAAWGEVARKLAHEIKNPLTPIQLSAQRVRKAWLKSDPGFERVLTECTRAIVDEVEALKNLVDEFAQFARLPAANLQPTALDDVVEQALSLYDGLFPGLTVERRLAPDLPPLRLDPDQMKRVHHQPRRQRGRGDGRARDDPRRDGVRPRRRPCAARGVRRRPRHRARGPRPAVRAALLDEEAGQRPRPRDREPHRAGAPRDDPGRGQPAAGRAIRRGAPGVRAGR